MNPDAVIIAVLVAAALAVTLGVALGWAAARIEPDADSLVDRIDALLPQTQCGQCRYPGCRPYAAAIASGAAEIDRCPPGGEVTVRALAVLLEGVVARLAVARLRREELQLAIRIKRLASALLQCRFVIERIDLAHASGAKYLNHSFSLGGMMQCPTGFAGQ